MRGKNTKFLLSCTAFLFLCMLACAVCVASARTIFVPDDYAKIQWAVDNASVGDTIIVRDGIYVENIDINKRLTIKSENGSAYCIVQAANKSDHVFEITADYVEIDGFTVKESGYRYAGIYLNDSDYCEITNNYCSDNYYGIILDNSNGNKITDNTCSSNDDGIKLDDNSNGNEITNNICFYNTFGIILSDSVGNKITNNTCFYNTWNGIEIDYSNSNEITNNKCSYNYDDGIELHGSNINKITNNICSYNTNGGIHLHYKAKGNEITNNICSYNGKYGIRSYKSNNNLIYLNNFINNIEDNANSSSSDNTWNSPEKITYTYNGSTYTNYMGNYWSDYTGSDKNGDGIGDTSYEIVWREEYDYYPLMEPWENYFPKNKPPIASFTYTPENPAVEETITFDASSSYDPDGTIVSYEWDFGDGNITNTTEEKINHSYSEAGIYEVTLTVKDDKGAKNSTTKIITVMPAQPSVSISTDKYEYTVGDVMLINITITNPRNEWQGVKFLWILDILDYDKHFTIKNRSLMLPPLYDKTFTLRWKLPELKSSFNASWHVAVFNKTTSELISEDYADWKYVAEKAKENDI